MAMERSALLHVSRDDMLRCYDRMYFLQDDVAWFVRSGMLFQEGMSIHTRATMTEQMKLWRKLAKEDKIRIMKKNCKSCTIKDRTYYMFVVQDKDLSYGQCPAALLLASELVDGQPYFFLNERNRDVIQEYVMKGLNDNDDSWYNK